MQVKSSTQLLAKARQTEGYIEKKSRSILGNWLRRYFIIVENVIEYFDDDSMNTKKGYIYIRKIRDLIPIGSIEFQFDYEDRKYEIRCMTQEKRDKWIRSINVIQEFLVSASPRSPKKTKPERKERKRSDDFKNSNGQLGFLLKKLQIEPLLNNCSEQKLYYRTTFLQTEEGIYWLVSFKPLENADGDYSILKAEDIAPYQLQTLYFLPKNQKQSIKICGTNAIANFTEFPSEFTIQFWEKDPLIIQTETIPMLWTKKFQKSFRKAIQFGKQYFNAEKLIIKRNIDNIVRAFDDNFAMLDTKIAKQFKETQCKKTSPPTISDFFSNLRQAVNLLVEVRVACKVKIPSRMDVFQYYCRKCHPEIYRLLFGGWNHLHCQFKTKQIGQLLILVRSYEEMITPYFDDSRLKDGISMLFKIYSRKIEQSMFEGIQQNLPRSELLQRDGIYSNKSTQLILSSILEDIRPFHPKTLPHTYLRHLLILINLIFKHYSERIRDYSAKWKQKQLIFGTCNDICLAKLTICNKLKKELCKDKTAQQLFFKVCHKEISNSFSIMCTELLRKIFQQTFGTIDRKLLTKNFGEIDMNGLLQKVLSKIEEMDKIADQVRSCIYLMSYDEICCFYFNSITKFQNTEGFTSELIAKKIANDLGRLESYYEKILTKQKMTSNLQDLNFLKDLLTCDNSKFSASVLHAKKIFRNALTEEVIRTLLKQRNGSLQVKKKLLDESLIWINRGGIFSEQSTSEGKEHLTVNWKNNCCQESKKEESEDIFQDSKEGLQGFLMKKKILKTIPSIFVRSYFRLKAGKLFEYQSRDSQFPYAIFDMEAVGNSFVHPEDYTIIVLEYKDQVYQLKSHCKDNAFVWLERIHQQSKSVAKRTKPQEQLFKDFFCVTTSQPMSVRKVNNSPKKLKKKRSDQGIGCYTLRSIFF